MLTYYEMLTIFYGRKVGTISRENTFRTKNSKNNFNLSVLNLIGIDLLLDTQRLLKLRALLSRIGTISFSFKGAIILRSL